MNSFVFEGIYVSKVVIIKEDMEVLGCERESWWVCVKEVVTRGGGRNHGSPVQNQEHLEDKYFRMHSPIHLLIFEFS